MNILRYTPTDAAAWDRFIAASRNGTFLFKRGFMDYHADRFTDHSLIITDEKGWVAVLPANEVRTPGSGEDGACLVSHGGLTYGGFVLAPRVGAGTVMALFDMVKVYLKRGGFTSWYYKQVPYIYHRQPAEDDEYALWRIGGRLEVCNLATAIDLRSPLAPAMEERRGRGQRRALKLGYAVRELTDPTELSDSWHIIEDNLRACHNTRPVHSCSEMQLLMGRFPQNIRVWAARPAAAPVQAMSEPAGTAPEISATAADAGIFVVFEDGLVAHSQYPHATPEGKQNGVMDLLIMHVLEYYRRERPDIRYFDFGISNEDGGRFLNEGLQAQKEGFGARGVTYRQWRIAVD